MSVPPPPAPGRVLVYHIGSLGDTLVALPALWALRAAWPRSRFTLLTKRTPLGHLVLADDILAGADLFDDFIAYPGERVSGGGWRPRWAQLKLLLTLRARRFQAVVYLAPSERQPAQVQRDRRLFAWAGIRRCIGIDGFPAPPSRTVRPVPTLPGEAQMLLDRVAHDGVPVPPLARARRDTAVSVSDEQAVVDWVERQTGPGATRQWLALAPGSNMPSKQWPLERFIAVARALSQEHGLWPVVFGGPQDRAAGERLCAALGAGWVAAGELSVRAAAAAMRRVVLYVGNDTGTMHLAASEGVRCVVPFAARDFPGKWHPIGEGHHVIRRSPACEGCMLERCEREQMRCLLDIDVGEVLDAARTCLTPRRAA